MKRDYLNEAVADRGKGRDLHDQLMNLSIPLDPKIPADAGVMLAYKLGHRDARHAAAELALAAPAVAIGTREQETGESLLRAIRKLPMVRAREIDGEESDGTPISWRDRPFVSLTQLERLLTQRAALAAPGAAIDAREQAVWGGWACQYPGKLPRLYGAKEIAELNCDEENGDRLLFLASREEAPAASALHPATADLVHRFSKALSEKLAAAEKKYGYSDGWLSPHWMDECRGKLLEHVAKGDPRDVAAYCAFLWHHDESTAPSEALSPATVAQPMAEWQLDTLNDDLIAILGRPNFTCIRIAQALRLCGIEIKSKAEYEQAAAIHFLLTRYLRHGSDWATHSDADLRAMLDQAEAKNKALMASRDATGVSGSAHSHDAQKGGE